MCEKEKETTRTPIWKERLKRHVPILKWFPQYEKTDLIADMIAGLTLGLTLIPQSIAYASLAGLSPEHGLYSSFMGSFVYVIFGTIKEVSVGPNSLISLLTLEFTRNLPIDYVFLMTLMCGCVELLLGVFQFGFLVNFISIPVTKSFQSATSLVIIASQLKDFFGITKFRSGRFLQNIFTVGKRIGDTRTGDLCLSIFCCVFLLSLRKLKDLKIGKNNELTKNQKILKKTLWFISISRNALCVFISIMIAYAFSLNDQFPFRLAGKIPSGLPSFRMPKFSTQVGNETVSFPEMIYEIGPGMVVIPFIAILANITIAKAFCPGSPVDATQEMITLGLCNITGSFVGSMPTGGAFTRSAVSNSSGIRTPLAGLFTGTLIILVIRFLTPYFFYIPRACLASVLICAVVFMFDWQTILLFWKVNKKDFFCSAVTFSACLLLGIQFGLLFGVIVNVAQLLYMWARPSISVEIKANNELSYYMVKPDMGLYFPATDFFRNEIATQCVQNIPVVVDCLHFKGIDYTTARGIKELEREFKMKNKKLLFINVSVEMYYILKRSKFEVTVKQCSGEDELRDVLLHTQETDGLCVVLREKLNFEEIQNPVNSIEEKALI